MDILDDTLKGTDRQSELMFCYVFEKRHFVLFKKQYLWDYGKKISETKKKPLVYKREVDYHFALEARARTECKVFVK